MSSWSNLDMLQEVEKLGLRLSIWGESQQTAMSSISEASMYDGWDKQFEAALDR